MSKTHINLGLSFSNAGLTHYGGLYLLQQFFQSIKLRSLLTQTLRFRQLNNRYSLSDSILAILYPIILGLGRIETNILLQQNGVFQYLASLPSYPDPTTLRRFLERFGSNGLPAFQNLHDRLRTQFLITPDLAPSVIFDLDTKVLTVYGQQQGARVGFNPKKRGRPSYQPTAPLFRGKNRRYLGRNLSPGRYASCSPHYPCSGKKHLETSVWDPRHSGASRFGLLRPYDYGVPSRSSSLLCNRGPGYKANSAIFWRPCLRGSFSWGLFYRVRTQTVAVECLPTLYRRATPGPRKTFVATLAFQDGWIHVPSNCYQSFVKTSESLALLQPKSDGRTYHSRTPRSVYLRENSHRRLSFKPSLFPHSPYGLQPDQLVQTTLFAGRLATLKSSDHPQPTTLSTSSTDSAARSTDSKFTKQLSILENVYTGPQKYQKFALNKAIH